MPTFTSPKMARTNPLPSASCIFGLAPAVISMSSTAVPRPPLLAASISGVCPNTFFASTDGWPLELIKVKQQSKWPAAALKCSGVAPKDSRLFTSSDPYLDPNKFFMTCSWPYLQQARTVKGDNQQQQHNKEKTKK